MNLISVCSMMYSAETWNQDTMEILDTHAVCMHSDFTAKRVGISGDDLGRVAGCSLGPFAWRHLGPSLLTGYWLLTRGRDWLHTRNTTLLSSQSTPLSVVTTAPLIPSFVRFWPCFFPFLCGSLNIPEDIFHINFFLNFDMSGYVINFPARYVF
jgi:hypothetical protein